MGDRSTAIKSPKHNLSINFAHSSACPGRASIHQSLAQWSPIYAKWLVQHSLETPTPLPRNISTRWKSFRVLVSALLKTVVMPLPSNYKRTALPRVIENYEDEQWPYFSRAATDRERKEFRVPIGFPPEIPLTLPRAISSRFLRVLLIFRHVEIATGLLARFTDHTHRVSDLR